MGQAGDYEALIRELLFGVAGGWSYGRVTLWLWNVDEEDLTLWLRDFAEGLSLERDRALIEQLKLLGEMTPGKLASEAFSIAARLNDPYGQSTDPYMAWCKHGAEVGSLGNFEEAISIFDKAIEINPDYHLAWGFRGAFLNDSGKYKESIDSLDRAIGIKPNEYVHISWKIRGNALEGLSKFSEAIDSFDRAIEIEADYHKAWADRGILLVKLGRYEEAISNLNRAIEINPTDSIVFQSKGTALFCIGRYEEAINSCNLAIEINHENDQAYCNRGSAMNSLERHEEAISSFDRAIEINPDLDKAWSNRGFVMSKLENYEEAIKNFDRSIKIKPDVFESWFGRGRAFGLSEGYKAEIKAYHEAFKHIRPETHPEGYGFLQLMIGRTYYDEGNNQLLNYRRNPHFHYGQALTSYHNALKTLTRAQFPKLRLETLIDTAKAYLAQQQPSAARDCQTEAVDILGDLLNAEPTFVGKKRLQLEYTSLRQLDVDLFVASSDNIRALQVAERDKNNHLIWLLTALDETIISPKYDQMQQLLTTVPGDRLTGIVYWHLSPDKLTTFILHPHKPQPEVFTSPSQNLRTWLKKYDLEKIETANWQELGNILQISQINRHLDGIEHLILIPHRDLHRLPLHSYWQNLTTTYLPSIQIGLNLQAKPQPNLASGFLLIESPNYQAATTKQKKGKTLGLLPSVEIEVAVIKALFAPQTTLPRGNINTAKLQAKLQQPHYYGHFNGHAYHDPRQPKNSSLILEGDDELTCSDLSTIDLNPYHLITLSACQTGVTTHQTIDTEYVGIVSAFLSRGTNYVVSTLWSVQDLPSSLLMMTFYWYLNRGIPAPLALRKAASWLRNKEAEFHSNIAKLIPPTNSTLLESINDNITAANKGNPDAKPYSSPQYWAAFTISGWG
jgi:tetratricopeptide (TPR) repeat protein/CHAT domain-containing protein